MTAGVAAVVLAGLVAALLIRNNLATQGVDTANGPASGPPRVTATSSAATSAPANTPYEGKALLTARVPAYCEKPEANLVDGKLPSEIAGEGNGQLVLEGAAAPVVVDLDGDRSPETIANYSCGASFSAAGAHWPDLLVIYGADGTIKGSVGLREHMLLGDTTNLTSLKAQGNAVLVEWFDSTRINGSMGRKGTLTWSGAAPTLDDGGIAGTVTEVVGRTGFASPSGNIRCSLSEESVFCGVAEHVWTAPPAEGNCQFIDYGDYVAVAGSGPARFACTGEVYALEAFVDWSTQMGGPGMRPGWFVEGTDPIVTSGSARLWGLSYDRTLKAGDVTCTLTQSGLTCANPSGGGFSVSRQTVEVH